MLLLRLLVALAVVSGAAPALASGRGWQGVTPGATTESEVTSRFGPPSTQGKLSGRNALVYKGDQAISGTRQAQFFARDDGVVVEVVVFPVNALDKETVEGTYGKPSQKAFTDDFRTVWMYKPTGITVYFGKEGTVEAISFKPLAGEKPVAGKAAPSP
ncbi:hypothetical protein [Anaeromyxobacter diazotrophicus]|uniref:Lipoprotein n=1 Tax=Anaeromyxobacter diazotrophicus TaxID=2590199 RepID=A0A7I9VJ67_9BACT|nr:hypothetical protein [Anaeromyxobacter diazotrophicus]GEJ56229.1 hypothetical protein AMYX_09700 [Anaeromyxobacter diazotrophicus]